MLSPLNAHLSSLDFSSHLADVKNLLDTAQVKTTFWGSRVVEVNGFTGSVYLEDMARKILNTSRQRSDADDLSPAERISGLDITRQLENFYIISDEQIQKSNFFTRFLNWIREFSFIPYTTRFYFEKTAAGNFCAYSEVKFLEQFGGSLNEEYEHPASYGSCSPPLRILAKEDQIRALPVQESKI